MCEVTDGCVGAGVKVRDGKSVPGGGMRNVMVCADCDAVHVPWSIWNGRKGNAQLVGGSVRGSTGMVDKGAKWPLDILSIVVEREGRNDSF